MAGPAEISTILSSTTETESGTGSSASIITAWCTSVIFQLDVTAAATDAGDTLDVSVQTTIDGTNWFDVVAFTQVLGNGGAKRHVAKVNATANQATFEASASLSAGSERDVLGAKFRAKWTIADAGTDNASFTFAVHAFPN